jgi:hypothetical protein
MKSTNVECTLFAVIGSKQKRSPDYFASGFHSSFAVNETSFISCTKLLEWCWHFQQQLLELKKYSKITPIVKPLYTL